MVRVWWMQVGEVRPNVVVKKRRVVSRTVILASAGAAVGLLGHRWLLPARPRFPQTDEKWDELCRICTDMVCGGFGEICQLSVLYPLDTIKVRCQATGLNFLQGIRQILCQGLNPAVFRSLYAGLGPAACCSVFVGAVYYGVYRAARRLAIKFQLNAKQQGMGRKGGVIKGEDVMSGGEMFLVDLFAAMCSCFATSLVDAPVEMVRHQVQAGVVRRDMISHMLLSFRLEGPRALYYCFIPYLIKAIPYDIAELMTHSQMYELRSAAQNNPTPSNAWNIPQYIPQNIPDEMYDMITGAAAGTAAVVTSMPADCIKTRMETETVGRGVGKSILKNGKAFVRCGSRMLEKEGMCCLFRGIVPRLLDHVPGTVVYWMAVEAFRRAVCRENELA